MKSKGVSSTVIVLILQLFFLMIHLQIALTVPVVLHPICFLITKVPSEIDNPILIHKNRDLIN